MTFLLELLRAFLSGSAQGEQVEPLQDAAQRQTMCYFKEEPQAQVAQRHLARLCQSLVAALAALEP